VVDRPQDSTGEQHRGESELERTDRNWDELLGELRVTQTERQRDLEVEAEGADHEDHRHRHQQIRAGPDVHEALA